MKLSKEVKNKIHEVLESEYFMKTLYQGLTDEEREELGMFYTPADICIQMIEKYTCTDFSGKNILDPTCGSGNLLIAMLIAGADSDKVYGNDWSPTAVHLCRERLNAACDILGKEHIQDWQIHRGDAVDPFCLKYFGPDYKEQLREHWEPDLFGVSEKQEEFLLGVD